MSFENTKIGPRRDHYFRANALARAPLGARVGEVDFLARQEHGSVDGLHAETVFRDPPWAPRLRLGVVGEGRLRRVWANALANLHRVESQVRKCGTVQNTVCDVDGVAIALRVVVAHVFKGSARCDGALRHAHLEAVHGYFIFPVVLMEGHAI